MIKENNTLVEQFLVLKELTKTTGALHEAQINQLRIWFQLLFEEIDMSTAGIDWSIPEKKSVAETISHLKPTIIYSFKTKIKKYLDSKQIQILILLNSIRFLLGKQWGLKFIINGKSYAISA